MDRNKKLILGFGILGFIYWFSTTGTGKNTVLLISDTVAKMTGNLTRGERNNNPGNIRPSNAYSWLGQIGVDSGAMGSYVIFDTPEHGIRAIAKDLLTKFNRGLNTVSEIIAAYAPPSENNTGSYISAVSSQIGEYPDTELDMRDISTLSNFVYAIIQHENGRVSYTPGQIAEGVSSALG